MWQSSQRFIRSLTRTFRRTCSVAIRAKLTTLEELAAAAPRPGASNKPKREISDEEKALRKERVTKAKDALARSVTVKGEHVARSREAIKLYLQQLNQPKQPDEAEFDALIEGPFRAPPKKKTNDRRF